MVPAIEKNDFKGGEKAIAEYAKTFQNIPALILGCTHYPLVKDLFQKALPKTRLICQDELMGQKLADYLRRHPEIESKLSHENTREFFVSSLSKEYKAVAQKLFPNIELKISD